LKESGCDIAPIARLKTATLDDSGRTTYVTGSGSYLREFWAYFNLLDIRNIDGDFFTQTEPTDYENAYDGDDSTYAVLYDNISDDGTDVEGACFYGIKNPDFINRNLPAEDTAPETHERINDISIQYLTYSLMSGGGSPAGGTMTITPYSMVNDTLASTYVTCSSSTSVRDEGSLSLNALEGKEWDAIKVKATITDGANADSTLDNYSLMRIYQVRIKVDYMPESYYDGYVACKGREYGSWITGRSSNYSANDVIEDPAGIIESILRDELSLGNDDIDLTTFIDAENTSVKMRLNLHSDNEGFSDDIIRKICEQATFVYFFGASGKARLIPLNDTSPSTAKTIPHSWIYKGDIKFSKSNWIFNKLNLESRYQQENGLFIDLSTIENSTSQAENWGTRSYTAQWKNLTGTHATHIANHLIRSADGSASDDDGIWCKPHVIIKFATVGLTCSDLEIGDWIELDDATCDSQIKCYGESWSGKQFLINKLEQGIDNYYTKIEAIELF
jgi:hypothetical protein